MLVAKLKGARDRKKRLTGKRGGRKNHQELNPEAVALARSLSRLRKKPRAKAASDTNALAPAYEPTAHERRALDAYMAKPLAPRLKISSAKDGVANTAPGHPDPGIALVVLAE